LGFPMRFGPPCAPVCSPVTHSICTDKDLDRRAARSSNPVGRLTNPLRLAHFLTTAPLIVEPSGGRHLHPLPDRHDAAAHLLTRRLKGASWRSELATAFPTMSCTLTSAGSGTRASSPSQITAAGGSCCSSTRATSPSFVPPSSRPSLNCTTSSSAS